MALITTSEHGIWLRLIKPRSESISVALVHGRVDPCQPPRFAAAILQKETSSAARCPPRRGRGGSSGVPGRLAPSVVLAGGRGGWAVGGGSWGRDRRVEMVPRMVFARGAEGARDIHLSNTLMLRDATTSASGVAQLR